MTLSESRDVGELYKNAENAELAKILAPIFKDMVVGLVSEIGLTHPYVGYKHFRDNVLAPAIARRLSHLAASLILNELTNEGILEVYQREVVGSEYPVSAIKKPESNGESTAELPAGVN